MKAQSTAEDLLRTDSDHWNSYALRFLVKVKEGGLFSQEDQAMGLYHEVVELAVEHHGEPLKAVAYWDRVKIKDVITSALEKYLEAHEKKNGPLKKVKR